MTEWRKWADETIARCGYPWDWREWDRARTEAELARQAAAWEAWKKAND